MRQLTPEKIIEERTISRKYNSEGDVIAQTTTSGDNYIYPRTGNFNRTGIIGGEMVRATYRNGVKQIDTHAFADGSYNKRKAIVPHAGTYKVYIEMDMDKADKFEAILTGKQINSFEIVKIK